MSGNTLLSWKAITQRAGWLLRDELERRDDVTFGAYLTVPCQQHQAVLELPSQPFTMTLDEFAEHHLAQSMRGLSGIIPPGSQMIAAPMVIRAGVDMGDVVTCDGCGMRAVRYYDINQDKMICRFDVRSITG